MKLLPNFPSSLSATIAKFTRHSQAIESAADTAEVKMNSAVRQKEAPTTGPPPYTVVPKMDDPSAVLQSTIAAVTQGRTEEPMFNQEAERLRRFMSFCLAVDYQCPTNIQLSASDRAHFIALSVCASDLAKSHDWTCLTWRERKILAPYFWRYLHAPCHALELPVDQAVMAIARYSRFATPAGRYKGCVYGLLHANGPETLAYKLHMDRVLVIPRIIPESDGYGRRRMQQRLESIVRQYFTSLSGASQYTEPYGASGAQMTILKVQYSLNERGASYEKTRQTAISVAKATVLTPRSQWIDEIKHCINGIRRRNDLLGERSTYAINESWRGPESVVEGTDRGSLRKWLNTWIVPGGVHAHDFFENRTAKYRSEV
jgi:hypothetical protein